VLLEHVKYRTIKSYSKLLSTRIAKDNLCGLNRRAQRFH